MKTASRVMLALSVSLFAASAGCASSPEPDPEEEHLTATARKCEQKLSRRADYSVASPDGTEWAIGGFAECGLPAKIETILKKFGLSASAEIIVAYDRTDGHNGVQILVGGGLAGNLLDLPIIKNKIGAGQVPTWQKKIKDVGGAAGVLFGIYWNFDTNDFVGYVDTYTGTFVNVAAGGSWRTILSSDGKLESGKWGSIELWGNPFGKAGCKAGAIAFLTDAEWASLKGWCGF